MMMLLLFCCVTVLRQHSSARHTQHFTCHITLITSKGNTQTMRSETQTMNCEKDALVCLVSLSRQCCVLFLLLFPTDRCCRCEEYECAGQFTRLSGTTHWTDKMSQRTENDEFEANIIESTQVAAFKKLAPFCVLLCVDYFSPNVRNLSSGKLHATTIGRGKRISSTTAVSDNEADDKSANCSCCVMLGEWLTRCEHRSGLQQKRI